MRWLIILFALMTSFSYADGVERIGFLAGKVVCDSSSGYYVLSDGSCWKVVSFQERWRTLSEWWHGVNLAVPARFKCLPEEWAFNSEIAVFSKNSEMFVDLENASNQRELIQCTHLLVNTHNNQILFATALSVSDCVAQIFDITSEQYYNKGFNAGRSATHQDTRDAYDEGWEEGYKEGYREGYKEGFQKGFVPGSSQ